ncbi:efflux RND transporter periplasmic adaptor subunit [Ramlibacter sp. MAHUQ-53]|uniref:efflux RND transporter periplasmic adaptor subunit n=1 Tax=unclassified Ramlibacter TaxID=2617605 RepID=UPI00363B62D7
MKTPLTLRAAVLAAAAALLAMAVPARAAELAAVVVQPGAGTASSVFDGSVEAVRQTTIAAQVAGAVVRLEVRAGDRVAAGQVLLELDARAAEQAAAASDAQVQAARAALDVATREFERQRRLHQQQYISQAALDRAEAEFRSTQAQVNAQLAQAGAARTQSGFYRVRAPYAGVVADVPVTLGDMALPGRPLVTVYDPAALRVTAAVPQSVAARLAPGLLPRVEVPGAAQAPAVTRAQVLPTVDPSTHTVQVRADLAGGAPAAPLSPGMFARLWLPVPAAGATATAAAASPRVPAQAVVRRGELTGLYVLDAQGRPVLRQVRLGRAEGGQVEVLAGLAPGERVATDPQAAARVR